MTEGSSKAARWRSAPAVSLVTDRRRLAPDARTPAEAIVVLERFLDEAIDAGVDLVQLRERDLGARILADCARRVARRAAAGLTRVLVNDRLDVALAADADGVHLRSDSVSPAQGRLVRAEWIIGRSVHAGDDVAALTEADYLLFGAVYETSSKPDRTPAGVEGLRAAVTQTTVPVLAIGGVTPDRARACRAAGAAGVAAIGIFLPEGRARGSLGVHRAVSELRAAMSGV